MSNFIIIILGIILLILIILNHITIVSTTSTTSTSNSNQGNCSQTAYGCCPDGVNSKVNYYGTNCPPYNPGPGYYPNVLPGGCAGTRYGCCPNQNPKLNPQGSNC